jgi:hypothetical protein
MALVSASERYIVVRRRRKGSLLCLEPSAKHFMRIGSRGCANLAEDCGSQDTSPVYAVIPRRGLAHFDTSERHLEELVERELNCDVREAQERRREAGVEGPEPFLGVHLPEGIEGVSVLPRRAMFVGCTRTYLRHEPSLDDPYRVCC